MEWISVKDRLPEESGVVVAAKLDISGECLWVMSLAYSDRHKSFNSYDWMDDKEGEIQVDFWTAMPKLPKG